MDYTVRKGGQRKKVAPAYSIKRKGEKGKGKLGGGRGPTLILMMMDETNTPHESTNQDQPISQRGCTLILDSLGERDRKALLTKSVANEIRRHTPIFEISLVIIQEIGTIIVSNA
jgi:hypothetical protein